MTDRICILDDCERPRYQSRDYCGSHYMKLWRYGDPYYMPKQRPFRDIAGQRFGKLTAVARTNGLWLCHCDCGNTTRVRIGDLARGTTFTCGERSIHRTQDVVTYAGAHDRVEAAKGKASSHRCVDCDAPAQQWSYDHADPDELRTDDDMPYSLTPDHYEPRCISCHRRKDIAAKRQRRLTA